MADTTISTGVQITVDASDIKNKFTKSVDELNASLSKNQKALGLVYNEQGILTNALGQTVEGLSQSSIKLGQYVDELGRVRTFQGGFTDGLTKTQIELGQYADELGNLYNRYGDWIGQTEKAQRAQEQLTAAIEKEQAAAFANGKQALESFSHATEGLAHASGQFAIFSQLITQSTGGASEFAQSIATTANSISVASSTFKASTELIKGFMESARALPSILSTVTTTATASTAAVEGLGTAAKGTSAALAAMGGPVTLTVAAIAAIGAGVAAWKSSQQTTIELSDAFKVLEERAAAAGRSINGVKDALEFGAFRKVEDNALVAASKELTTTRAKLQEATAAYQEAVDAANEARKYATGSGYAGPSRKAFNLDQLGADYKEAIAKYNEITQQYVDAAKQAQQTEIDKLQEQRANYAGLLKVAEQLGNDDNADLFRRQIEMIDGQIKDVKQKELDAAKTAQESARQEAIAGAGLTDYLKRAADAAKGGAIDLEKWKALVADGSVTQAEYNAALAQYQADIEKDRVKAAQDREALRVNALKELGVSLDERPLTFGAKTERLDALLQAGTIKQSDYNNAIEQLTLSARSAIKGLDEIGKESVDDEVIKDAIAKYYAGADLSSLEELSGKVADAAQRTLLESFVEIENAFNDGVIKEQERDKLLDNAYAKLAQARDDETKSARQELDKIRQNLGIDSLLEELKTPLDKYYDALDEIAEAMRQGAIQENERQLLTDRAAQKYLDALNDKVDFKGLATGSNVGKGGELANSYSAGSEALYVAQVRQSTTNYQSAMQSTTNSIKNACVESLNESRLATQYLEEIATRDALQVWG